MKEHGFSRQLYFGILVLDLLCGSLSAESIWNAPLPVAADGSRELTITSENKGAHEFVSFPLDAKKIAGRRLILSADVRTDLEHSPAAMAGAKLMINGKWADTSLFYSYSFPAETDQKSGKNAETPLDRNSGCNHERHIEQSNRRSEQQNRGHQTLSV